MIIDLQKLNYMDKIAIDELIVIPSDYYENTDIKSLDKVKVNGEIIKDLNKDYFVNLKIESKMFLQDSLSLDEIPYDFTVNIEETLEKTVKTLDLIDFLWHYIMLEVPLRITKSEGDYPKGEFFRVISEEEYSKMNNPFKDFHLE